MSGLPDGTALAERMLETARLWCAPRPTTMNTMRAFAIERFGDGGRVQSMPIPEIGDDELLVRVVAAGLNPLDLKIQDGLKAAETVRFPFVLGQDAAGVVERVGRNVLRFAPGSQVYGAFWMAGALAEYVRVPIRAAVAHKPVALGYIDAAALPTPALAAVAAIRAVELKAAETVLIVGATGSVGRHAAQLAHACEAKVIATSRPDAEDTLRAFGVQEFVDYTTDDLVSAVRSKHPEGIDAVIDMVSPWSALARVAEAVRPGGHVASTIHAADVDALRARGITAHNIDVFGATCGLDELARWVDAGALKVTVHRTFPLEATPEALTELRAGHASGKLIVRV